MKTRLRVPQLLAIVCGISVIAAASGQVVLTWTNNSGGLITADTNWNPNRVPDGNDATGTQETARWDGVMADLVITNGIDPLPKTGFGSLGINLFLTSNQTGSVHIVSSVPASPAIAVFSVTNGSASAALTFGESGANYLTLGMRPAGAAHYWVNNSAAPVTINRSVRWEAGGGVSYSLDLGGTGDWIINNNIVPDAGPKTSITKSGSGTMTWTAVRMLPNFIGPVSVNGGTLLVNGTNAATSITVNAGVLGGSGVLTGPVILKAGTLFAPGGSAATLTISSNLSFGGDLIIEVDKSLAQPNYVVIVNGTLNNTGCGTVKVKNIGPALAIGDEFALFSKPLQGGEVLLVKGSGAIWTNHLARDGTISVIGFLPSPMLNFTNIGEHALQFSWTGDFKLQAQTNELDVGGIAANWVDYPAGSTSPVLVPIGISNETVFFRLAPQP